MALLLLSVLVAGCATAPPSQPDDLCAVFTENDGWREDAHKAEARWGVSVPIIMAFMRHESSFQDDARPERERILWIIPWNRPSTAYGYAQATDETWAEYERATGRSADRDDFEDSADFIGWFGDRVNKELAIPKDDTYRLYLAFHEGRGGYRRGTYREKGWLLEFANRVKKRAEQYARDLRRCDL